MSLRRFCLLVLTLLIVPLLAVSARADIFGSAATYAVLATTQVTNNPATNLADTVITGDMGDTSCAGFVLGTGCTLGFGTVSGAVNSNNAAWTTALVDSNTAYTALANTPFNFNFTGSCLGSGVGCINNLVPGVYRSTLTATLLNGALTLDGGSNTNPLWIFQMATGFTTASNSSVLVTGTGAAAAGVYFEVGSQATLGSDTAFQGNILAGTAVAFDPGAQITCGRAFTDTPAGTEVTFAGNNPATPEGVPNKVSGTCAASSSGYNSGVIVTGPSGTPIVAAVPEPSAFVLLSSVLLAMVFLTFRKSAV
jgi:type VI secretion system secreted protein VgrG